MLELMPKLLEDKRIDILTMTFIFIQKLRTVGGPLLWEALGRGLLGLCLKMALGGYTLLDTKSLILPVFFLEGIPYTFPGAFSFAKITCMGNIS